jgi:Protein kinase domain
MAAQNTMPEQLGPYRLLEKIGEGGMGVVHLARDPAGKQVAVKVLRPGVAGDPDARRRLSREFEMMRRVRSPFVAAVIDADVTGPQPYVVTRYVAGPSLDQMIHATGPLRGRALERLAWGLAEGLAAVHAAGVVHRDLKPGNVVMAGGVPVLIDFGIAHAPDATKITQTGMFMGTPGYLAPEIVEGQPSGPAADVHSWGSTVAFAATGRAPFGTGTYETIFYRIVSGKPDLAGIPRKLLPMVTAALARDPATRPSAVQLSTECAALDLSGPDTGAEGLGTVAGAAGAGAAAGALGAAALAGHGTVLDPGRPGQGAPGQAGPGQAWPGGNGLARVRSAPIDPAQYADMLPPALPPGNGQALRQTGQAGVPAPAPAAGTAQGSAGLRGALSLATMAAAVAVSVLLPIAGTVLSLIVILLLRAADLTHRGLLRRRNGQGARPSDLPIMILKTPWAMLRAVVGVLILAPLALICAAIAAGATILAMHHDPLGAAGAFAAGAFIACYGFGPGSATPRRQLGRIYGGLTRNREVAIVMAGVVLLIALAVIGLAASQPHDLWPLTASIAARLGWVHHLVQTVQHRLQRL